MGVESFRDLEACSLVKATVVIGFNFIPIFQLRIFLRVCVYLNHNTVPSMVVRLHLTKKQGLLINGLCLRI